MLGIFYNDPLLKTRKMVANKKINPTGDKPVLIFNRLFTSGLLKSLFISPDNPQVFGHLWTVCK
jgi:hypothetical protein